MASIQTQKQMDTVGRTPEAIAAMDARKVSVSKEFNFKAAGDVFNKAGTLDLKGVDAMNYWYNKTFDNGDIGADDVNVDDTIKGSTVQTNLEALYAGYKGTDAEASAKTFKDVILAHPDLTKAADAMLKDEGENVLSGMEKLLTGNGKMDTAAFAKAMEDPDYRDVVAQMMKRVGTSDLGMDYTVEFTNDAMDAIQNPTDFSKSKKFLQTAKNGGIDTTNLEEKAGGQALGSIFDFLKDPEKGITQFMASMNLPPDLRNMLTSILTEVAGFYKDAFGHYAYGDGNQPGLVQIFSGMNETAQIDGQEKFNKHVASVAAPSGP